MEETKSTVEAVEAVVENNDVMQEAVKTGLTFAQKKVIYMVAAAAISAGATYVIIRKLQERAKAKTEDANEATKSEPKVKMALLKNKPVKSENCENESPKFEPDENR